MKTHPNKLMTRTRDGEADALAEICDHYRSYLRGGSLAAEIQVAEPG